MKKHIGIVCIGHGASAFFVLDACAHLFHGLAAPNGDEIVVMIAHVADWLGPDTAAPQITVGSNVGTGPSCITGNDLIALVENAFG